METRAKAPRITAFMKKTQGRSVIVMPRDKWATMGVKSTNVVQIDIQKTPIARVAEDSCVLAAIAQKYGPSDAKISVYRYDEKDPRPINVDHYDVWLDLVSHPRIQEMVMAASTSLDDNLRRFSRENVFLVLEHLADDHWLEDLPDSVVSICVKST